MEWVRDRYVKLLAIKSTAKKNMSKVPIGSPKHKFYQKVINKVNFKLEMIEQKFGRNSVPIIKNIKGNVRVTVMASFLRQ